MHTSFKFGNLRHDVTQCNHY